LDCASISLQILAKITLCGINISDFLISGKRGERDRIKAGFPSLGRTEERIFVEEV
jgi:hypothetical protein